MEEFDKIKAFSESVAERQAHLPSEVSQDEQENKDDAAVVDFPKYLSQFRPQVSEEKAENNLLYWAIGGLVLVLVAGVGGFFYFYGPQDSAAEIFEIRPTPTPVKVRPENPGGLQIAGTDKVIYDRTSAHKAEVMEKLFPEPEQPVAPPPEQVLSVEEMMPPVPQEIEEISAAIEPEAVSVPVAETREVVEEPVAPAIQDQPVAAPQETKPIEAVEPEPVVVPAPKPTTPKDAWRAQLLSSSSEAKVEKAWKGILKKHKALLSDMPYQIVPVVIPGKGTFYRLQVGSFNSADQVRELCAKLKKQKQECIPTKQDNK